MYYRIDLKGRRISTISSSVMEAESQYLISNNYEFIFLPNLESFIHQNEKLPARSILMVQDECYTNFLTSHLMNLLEAKISIIIFLPILFSANSIQYHEKTVQQLNDFIFSEAFKNIFSYTQLNDSVTTTNS